MTVSRCKNNLYFDRQLFFTWSRTGCGCPSGNVVFKDGTSSFCLSSASSTLKYYVKAKGAMERSVMWEEWQKEIRHCRITRAFDRKLKKIEIHIVHGAQALAAWETVLMAMKSKDKFFKPMCGIAPRGDLERKLQAFLEEGIVPNIMAEE